ncbi:hypothetical protein C0989_008332 [Termitomyces sp. Mn162]|nr:hypothetical protein C0989_008332 [Termitomyces sp. Mn162]
MVTPNLANSLLTALATFVVKLVTLWSLYKAGANDPTGAMIPNYFGKRLYMERIEEWHWLNPGQIVTGRLSSNANPDPEQAAMQQLLIHEVMQQDVAMGRVLSKEEWIEALERKLFALRQNGQKFDGVQVPRTTYRPANDAPKAAPSTSNTSATSSPSDSTTAPAAKPADKGKAPEYTIANEPPSVAKEPVAQPPIHPFSGIPSCYAPPLTGILLLSTELTTAHIKLCHPFMTLSNPRQFLNGS